MHVVRLRLRVRPARRKLQSTVVSTVVKRRLSWLPLTRPTPERGTGSFLCAPTISGADLGRHNYFNNTLTNVCIIVSTRLWSPGGEQGFVVVPALSSHGMRPGTKESVSSAIELVLKCRFVPTNWYIRELSIIWISCLLICDSNLQETRWMKKTAPS